MSTLALLVVLLLFLVGALVVTAIGYAAYRRPVLTAPLTVALTGAAVLVAMVTTVASAAGR
ncbi:hypothetical protein [Streptomyces olivaceoviridis]